MFEDVILARSGASVLRGSILEEINRESEKGCTARIAPYQIPLEPDYIPIRHGFAPFETSRTKPDIQRPLDHWLRIWIAPEQKFEPARAETLLKQLRATASRIAFEIRGNSVAIETRLACTQPDLIPIESAFLRTFVLAKTQRFIPSPIPDHHHRELQLRDLYPSPPYSKNLTQVSELKLSPLELVVGALQEIPPPALGFVRILFQGVDPTHDWHDNIRVLADFEYLAGVTTNGRQATQQLPSIELRNRAATLQAKAHDDKPLFSTAVRIGTTHQWDPSSLVACFNVFQYGSKPIRYIDEYDYHSQQIRLPQLINQGEIYRPGFLLNSRELSGLVHLIPGQCIALRRVPLPILETLPVQDTALATGTEIGETNDAGKKQTVAIPDSIRARGTHLIGASGTGKSTVMTQMFLQDVQRGEGAVFIDAHGDTVEQIANLLESKDQERCIFFDPGDREWIPCWNPLVPSPGVDRYRMTDDFLSALEHVSRDWGDRLGHILRNGIIGLSFLEDASLFDLYNLIRRNSPESEALRRRILECPLESAVRRFWERDFNKDYRDTDLSSAKHKLHRLLAGGSVAQMLTQRQNKIDLRKIMDTNRVLLVDLSSVGGETREILGSLILTLLFMTGLGRSDVPRNERKRFSIYADEAHLFVSADAIEQLITQARKFEVRLCLAHQYLKQFSSQQVDALSTMGCTIVGCIDKRDSQYLAKDLQDTIDPMTLAKLRPFEMVARIGSEVVRFKTRPCECSVPGYLGEL